jgi:hypothetical protein
MFEQECVVAVEQDRFVVGMEMDRAVDERRFDLAFAKFADFKKTGADLRWHGVGSFLDAGIGTVLSLIEEYIPVLNAFQGAFPKKTCFDVPVPNLFSGIIADTV